MNSNFKRIFDYWRTEYSTKIAKSKKFEMPAELKRIANMAAPGESFYYVANFHTLELELLSTSIERFLGLPSKKVDMHKILSLADSSDIEVIHLKERVAKCFYIDFLTAEEVLDYKVLYTYNLIDYKKQKRLMLHQACALSVDASGRFVHVFSIHSDISHLTAQSTRDISFIHLDCGESFLNVPIDDGVFDPQKVETDETLDKILSEREKEIVLKFSQGLSSEEVGKELFISPNTVRTHRKNILKKTGAKNSLQLVSKCITAGIIVPRF